MSRKTDRQIITHEEEEEDTYVDGVSARICVEICRPRRQPPPDMRIRRWPSNDDYLHSLFLCVFATQPCQTSQLPYIYAQRQNKTWKKKKTKEKHSLSFLLANSLSLLDE